MSFGNLNGKAAIVTGAAQGMGKAIALQLAQSGQMSLYVISIGKGQIFMLKDSQFVQPVLDKKVLDERIFGQKSDYCFFGKRTAFFVGIF